MSQTPWYKQFWPWFLMFFPVVTIVGCVLLVLLAVGNGPDMVVDDYYKKGKAINLELDKYNKAKALFLHGNMAIDGDLVTFTFTKGDYDTISAIKLSAYHATQEAKDVETTLTKNARGGFSGILPTELTGRYTLFLSPMDDSWKLKHSITLPDNTPFTVAPNFKK